MVLGPLLGENAGSDSGAGDVWVAEGYAYRTSMQPGTPRFSGGETKSRPNIVNVWPIFDYFRTVLPRTVASSRQRSWRREFAYLCT